VQLNHIITAYRERRHTYALEVYYCLLQKENLPYLALFYAFAATPGAIIRSGELAGKLGQDVVSMSRRLAYLAEMECLTEIDRVQRIRRYRLSDLGQCVLACLAPDPPVSVLQILHKTQLTTRREKQHIKWEPLRPQIKQFVKEDLPVAEIARRLGIKVTTLQGYMRRSGLLSLRRVKSEV
jgi:hypothetical protein